MKKTNKYGLTYFEKGDFTGSKPELQRWETLDNQLRALFEVLGNGAISGWDIIESSGLSISITPGSGHVSFVAVKSINIVSLNLIDDSINYIYASLTSDSYWTKNVAFHVEVFENTNSNVLLLGIVETSNGNVISISTDEKQTLGFISLVNNAVKNHRHIGGLTNPQQVNLATDVYGTLGQDNIGDLDASVIQTGTIDAKRLPIISHVTGLSDQGSLTHSQLDSVVNNLSLPDQTTMGETSSINFLQLVLALKHIYPDIDEFLNNEIAIIPGISPDDYIDLVNTTATVDLRTHAEGGTHTISGQQSSGIQEYTRIWDTEADFNDANKSNVLVIGDSVSLAVKANDYIIDDFSDINTWIIQTQDLSSLPSALTIDSTDYVVAPNSAKLVVGNSSVDIILKIKKSFISQDWSDYNYLKFYIKTESIQHGDLFFYLNDNSYGMQNSYQVVLNRNSPTINIDTLQRGWQEVTIDLTPYNRTQINEIGFYVSTQNGWDTAKGFNFNIDSISLASGNIYETDGSCNFIFGSDFLYDFWKIRWNAIVPTDLDSSGVEFKVRTRVANSIEALSSAVWSDYSSISGYELPIVSGEMYKYIEIECYFVASTNLKRSVTLKKLYLDFYAVDVDNFFYYSTKTDWDSGYKYNIDTNTVSNSMSIYGTSEIGNVDYGTDGAVFRTDSDYVEKYKIQGTTLPKSTYQIVNGLPPSFGLITAVSRGNNGSLWVSDTDNDRVLEMDASGSLIRGFFGSYLVENDIDLASVPTDLYGLLLPSNVISANTTGTVTSFPSELASINEVIYNQTKGYLYLIFNRELDDTELTAITNLYIKIGNNYFYLDNMIMTKPISGIDHVIRVEIIGADYTLLNYLLYPSVPSVLINSPLQNERKDSSNVACSFVVNGFDLGDNKIRVTLDSIYVQDINTTSTTFYELSEGEHLLDIKLVNSDSTLCTNIESIATGNFVVKLAALSEPYLSVISPRSNQIFSSSPIQIDFSVENFPIVPNGQHIRYSVDGGFPIDYFSSGPIIIDDLLNGKHTVILYLVDESGNDLGYTYGTANITFIVGTNSLASAKFYCLFSGSQISSNICSANLLFSDVYAPFDIQYIPQELSIVNPNGKESILIGKLSNNHLASKE